MVHQVASTQEYNESVKSGLVLVDFYADWCGPCKMIAPKLEKMSEEFKDVKFLKVNVDDLDEVTGEAGVSAMPTFLGFKNGVKVGEVVGANETAIRQLVEKLRSA